MKPHAERFFSELATLSNGHSKRTLGLEEWGDVSLEARMAATGDFDIDASILGTTDERLPRIENGSIDPTERLLIDLIKNGEEYDGDLYVQEDVPLIF